jgi:hypothetical protein
MCDNQSRRAREYQQCREGFSDRRPQLRAAAADQPFSHFHSHRAGDKGRIVGLCGAVDDEGRARQRPPMTRLVLKWCAQAARPCKVKKHKLAGPVG